MIQEEVETYMQSVPRERLSHVKALHEMILRLFPDATVDMAYRMPTYHHGEGWVAVANQKRYVSLYTCGFSHIAPFIKKHPEIKTGRGCINLKESDQLPVKDLEDVVRHAILHPKE